MKFKEFLENKGFTMEQYDAMELKEIAKLNAEYQEAVSEKLNDALESFKTNQTDKEEVTLKFDEIGKQILEQGEVLSKLETKGGPVVGNFKTELRKGLEKNKESLCT